MQTVEIEQLAGDLPAARGDREHRIASGYNRLGMMSKKGACRIWRMEQACKYTAERVRNISGTARYHSGVPNVMISSLTSDS
ncbi:MAG: hypothetical protein U0936_02100 [Planctomycetaceae bacterium]